MTRRAGRAILAAMLAIQRILCPVDFSETSQHAFRYALLLAQKFAAELVVLHVIEDAPVFAAFGGAADLNLYAEAEKAARREFAELLAGADPGGSRLRSEIVRGRTYKTILSFAAEHRSDVIVMGTHGRSGLEYAFFGSVTERVMRHAPCPVLIVRHPEAKGLPQAERK